MFLTHLDIKWPFKFLPHKMSVSALLEENKTSKMCIKVNKDINKFRISIRVAPNSPDLSPFDNVWGVMQQ